LYGSNCKKSKDCPPESHNQIKLINSSSVAVNWEFFSHDTVFRINGGLPNETDRVIQPGQIDWYNIRTETCWEEIFKMGHFEYFMIFSNDTVKAIGWESISGTNRGLLKNVKVDSSYLRIHDFSIEYP